MRGTLARILAIDDEELVLRMLQRALAEHELVTARDGIEALEILERTYRPFDAVLCDVVMPRMGGTEVWKAVARRWPELVPRFVVVSGGVLEDADRRFLYESGVRIVWKPFSLDELRDVVRDAVVGAAPPERAPRAAVRG
jgi:two-component system NtrC family sensor kinase